MQKNTIEISSKLKKDLVKEFDVSLTTVQLSLNFFNNSDLAKRIRSRAKELLLIEAEKI